MNNHDFTENELRQVYGNALADDSVQLKQDAVDIERAGQGVNTGFVLHNRKADGTFSQFDLKLAKYAVTMVTARTGDGKTTWMTNLAVGASNLGSMGMFVTLEEPRFQIRAKMLACYSVLTNLNFSSEWIETWQALNIINGKNQNKAFPGFMENISGNCRIIDANRDHGGPIEATGMFYTPQYLADLVDFYNVHNSKPLEYIIIDFGQLMESVDADNSNSYQRMKSVMQSCKNLAAKHGIAVVIGAQLQRSCSALSPWEYQSENIRDGSDMEQAASLILASGHDKKYPDQDVSMVCRVLKNRNGPKRVSGMFNINFPCNFIPRIGVQPEDY